MTNKRSSNSPSQQISAQPRLHQRVAEIQEYGTVTNDLLISEVLRTNELQVWFLSEHLVDTPLAKAAPMFAERD